MIKTRNFWSEEDLGILNEMFADNYTGDICAKLNRSYKSISEKAHLMGLKKSVEFMKKELARRANILKISGEAHRYTKGNIPDNKGKKMPKDTYEKCKPTMFKKGDTPHNATYDGHERLNKKGYTEIRIRQGKYILKHWFVWEQANGEIPKGFIVVFKDKNPQNLCIENLELITRKENMQRNTLHRFPAELQSIIRLSNKLNREINAKEQN